MAALSRSIRIAALLLLVLSACDAQVKLTYHTPVIANGAAVSSGINTRDEPIVCIDMPAAWTAASLALDGSSDGSTWKPIYDISGSRFTIAVAAGRMVAILPLEIQGVRWIRLRSVDGSGNDVNQGGARTITLITRRVP